MIAAPTAGPVPLGIIHRVDAGCGGLVRVFKLLSFPAVLVGWFMLAFLTQQKPSLPLIGPLKAAAVLLLLLPAILFWSQAPYVSGGRGRVLRALAVLGAVGGLCIIRLDAVVPAAPRSLSFAVSLVLLVPAGVEWMLARPWQSPVKSQSATISASILDRLYDFAVVIALPLTFLFTAPIQRFLPPGWVDAGIYLGLSFDYVHLVELYGWNYYALRVSYLLPSFLANLILPPVPARFVIVAVFYLLGVGGLYAGVRLLWGRMAATLAVALLAYNPLYLMSITAGYVDGPVAAYLLVLFAALAAWSRSRSDAWLIAAGASGDIGRPGAYLCCGTGRPDRLVLRFSVLGERGCPSGSHHKRRFVRCSGGMAFFRLRAVRCRLRH